VTGDGISGANSNQSHIYVEVGLNPRPIFHLLTHSISWLSTLITRYAFVSAGNKIHVETIDFRVICSCLSLSTITKAKVPILLVEYSVLELQ
jgi:hypothetical protein